jgi:beta-1,2-mannobiose phosphorylase / 1,2-beta-oligomannan phosphorylase
MTSRYVLTAVLFAFSQLGIAHGYDGDSVNLKSFTDRGVMMFGDTSRGGKPFAKDPSVKKFKGCYFLYYSIPPHVGMKGWSIGIATSKDLVTWKKVGVLKAEQPVESKGFCAPGAEVIGDKIHLFYQTYGNNQKDAICHAWSSDGINFTRDQSNPVFHPVGAWTCGRAIDAEAIPFGDHLLLFFASRDPSYKIQFIGVAAAPLNSDFSRSNWRELSNDPILRPTLSWERNCIEAPTVILRNEKLFMFYAGG